MNTVGICDTAGETFESLYARIATLESRLREVEARLAHSDARRRELECAHHEKGCPSICDDDSDQVLSDYQECVCSVHKLREAQAAAMRSALVGYRNDHEAARDCAGADRCKRCVAADYALSTDAGRDVLAVVAGRNMLAVVEAARKHAEWGHSKPCEHLESHCDYGLDRLVEALAKLDGGRP